jgi:hypothetical protein
MMNFTKTALVLGLISVNSIVPIAPTLALDFGTWKFTIDQLNSDPGGTLIVDIQGTYNSGNNSALITSISGSFTENGGPGPESIHLIAANNPPYSGTSGATNTDNLWLSALPVPNNNIHLDTGGFAFYYGDITPPALEDQYQLFYADNSYQGCWGTGGCQKIDPPTPVPFEFSAEQGFLLGIPLFIGLRVYKKKKSTSSIVVDSI